MNANPRTTDSRKIDLICLDVDGTLIGQEPVIHERVWKAARSAQAAGIHLAICTGRPGIGPTEGYAEALDPDGWHIFQGGASLYHLKSKAEKSHPLQEQKIDELCALQKKEGWVLEWYSNGDFTCDAKEGHGFQLAVDHARLIGLKHTLRKRESLKGEPVRAQWVVTTAQLDKVLSTAPEGLNYASATSPSVPGVHFVSVTTQGVNKCTAIETLATEILGSSLAKTMMVGDGQNDLSALEMVGYPVAMENADPLLAKVAKYRAGHVEVGGAADAILLAIEINQSA